MPLLILIPILGWIGAWVRFSKQSFAQSAIQSFSLILLILYFSALLNVLYWGMVLVISIGILLLLLSKEEYLRIIKKGENEIFTLCLFIVLPILFWWIHKDSKLFFWDEYSHWGMFIKHMYYTDKLYDLESNASNLRYFPGTALIQYLFIRNFEFSEGGVYLAQFVIILIPLIVFFEFIKNSKFLNYIFLFIVFNVGIHSLGHGLLKIYVDHILSVWAASLLITIINSGAEKNTLILFAKFLPCLTLILVKDAGVIFAAGIIGIYFLINFPYGKNFKFFLWKQIFQILPIMMAGFLIIIFWNINRNIENIPSSSLTTPGVLKGIFVEGSQLTDDQYSTMTENYWNVLYNLPIKNTEEHRKFNEFNFNLYEKFSKFDGLTTLGWMMVLFFISILSIQYSENRQRESIFHFLIFTWFSLYLFILLGSFLYRGPYDGYTFRFPSLVRFIHSGLLVVYFTSIIQLIINFSKTEKNKEIKIYFSVLTCSWLVFSETPYLEKSFQTQSSGKLREQIRTASVNIKRSVKDTDSVWIYSPIQDNGFISTLFRYELEPARVIFQNQEISDEQFIDQWKSVNWLWFPINQSMQKGVLKKLYEDTEATFFSVRNNENKLEIVGIKN